MLDALLAILFNLAVCYGIPLAVLIWAIAARRRQLPAFLMGIAAFALSQVLLRIPLLGLVSKQAWYQNFSQSHPVLNVVLVGGFTAGLFEETARYAAMRLVLKNRTTLADGVFFGLGHGGFEAAWLVGPAWVKVLTTQFGMLPLLPPLSLLPSGVERLLTILVHIGFSLVVMQGVRRKRPWMLAVSIGLHTLVNSTVVLVLMFTGNVWLCEGLLALFALAAVLYALFLKRKENAPHEEQNPV